MLAHTPADRRNTQMSGLEEHLWKIGIEPSQFCGDVHYCAYTLDVLATLSNVILVIYMLSSSVYCTRIRKSHVAIVVALALGTAGHAFHSHVCHALGVNLTLAVGILVVGGNRRALQLIVFLGLQLLWNLPYVLGMPLVSEVAILATLFLVIAGVYAGTGDWRTAGLFATATPAVLLDTMLCAQTFGCGTHWLAHAVFNCLSVATIKLPNARFAVTHEKKLYLKSRSSKFWRRPTRVRDLIALHEASDRVSSGSDVSHGAGSCGVEPQTGARNNSQGECSPCANALPNSPPTTPPTASPRASPAMPQLAIAACLVIMGRLSVTLPLDATITFGWPPAGNTHCLTTLQPASGWLAKLCRRLRLPSRSPPTSPLDCLSGPPSTLPPGRGTAATSGQMMYNALLAAPVPPLVIEGAALSVLVYDLSRYAYGGHRGAQLSSGLLALGSAPLLVILADVPPLFQSLYNGDRSGPNDDELRAISRAHICLLLLLWSVTSILIPWAGWHAGGMALAESQASVKVGVPQHVPQQLEQRNAESPHRLSLRRTAGETEQETEDEEEDDEEEDEEDGGGAAAPPPARLQPSPRTQAARIYRSFNPAATAIKPSLVHFSRPEPSVSAPPSHQPSPSDQPLPSHPPSRSTHQSPRPTLLLPGSPSALVVDANAHADDPLELSGELARMAYEAMGETREKRREAIGALRAAIASQPQEDRLADTTDANLIRFVRGCKYDMAKALKTTIALECFNRMHPEWAQGLCSQEFSTLGFFWQVEKQSPPPLSPPSLPFLQEEPDTLALYISARTCSS